MLECDLCIVQSQERRLGGETSNGDAFPWGWNPVTLAVRDSCPEEMRSNGFTIEFKVGQNHRAFCVQPLRDPILLTVGMSQSASVSVRTDIHQTVIRRDELQFMGLQP